MYPMVASVYGAEDDVELLILLPLLPEFLSARVTHPFMGHWDGSQHF